MPGRKRGSGKAGKQYTWIVGQRGSGAAGRRLLSVLVGLALACAGPRQNVDPAPEDETKSFLLLLTNRYLLDVNVFLQHDGQADRIAMVNSASSRTLELPLHMLGQGGAIRLIAEPIGDDTRYTTDILTVQPGQMVELNVENPIARSNYSIQ